MDLTVGYAGSNADRIVSGTSADAVINQALADVGASGGGKVTVLAGTYSVASTIKISQDHVTLAGAGSDQTTLRALPSMDGKGTIIQAQADDFTIQGLTVDGHVQKPVVAQNGTVTYQSIQVNPITATECTGGVIQNCQVLLDEQHTYGIWLVFSDGIKVINNVVDGTNPTSGQEGIETWSSSNVEISGNTIKNIMSSINLSSVPTKGYGDVVHSDGNLQVFNNTIDNAHDGISISVAGPRSFGNIDVHDNTLTNILEWGIRTFSSAGMTGAPADEWADPTHPQSLHDIAITDNQIGFASVPLAGYGIGIYLANLNAYTGGYSTDYADYSNIVASGNTIFGAIRSTLVTDFDHFSLDQNIITGAGTTITGTIYSDTIQGNALNNILISGGGSDTWIGGAGADTFCFAADTLTNHLFGVVHDYDQGNSSSGTFDPTENDCVDLSSLLGTLDAQHLASSLRALEGVSGDAAALQMDVDPTADGQNWVTIGRLDGLQAGADINVTSHSVAAEVAVIATAPAITTNGDGSYSAFYVDTAHEMTWTTLVANYDSNNHEITSTAANDDGSSSINYFDFNNAFDWATISNSYNAAGQQLTSAVHNDDGSFVNYYEDPSNQQNYSEIVNSYDTHGNQVTGAVTNDDGSSVAYYYDTTDQQEWSQIVNSYDADGNQVTSAVTNDDGSVVNYYENPSAGVKQTVNAYASPGVSALAAKGFAAAESSIPSAPSDSPQLSQSITFVSGLSQSHYWDVADQFNWSEIINTYDDDGQKSIDGAAPTGVNHQLTQNILFDDGTSQTHEWDVENLYTWSERITTLDSSGHVVSETGINHDGTPWTLMA